MSADKAGSPSRAWQRMLSGRRLDLLDPSPLDIEISDIAHGLARVARWNGQTTGEHAFSVAEHCVWVEHLTRLIKPDLSAHWRLAALLHDAPEYVIGDMISPFKTVLGGAYKDIEQRLQQAIHLRFSLQTTLPEDIKKLIKKADMICAYFEAVELAGFSRDEANRIFGRPRVIKALNHSDSSLGLRPLPASQAQTQFMERFIEIQKLRDETPL